MTTEQIDFTIPAMAVSLVRYDKPKRMWGVHFIYIFTVFRPWRYRAIPDTRLYDSQEAVKETILSRNNTLTVCKTLDEIDPELREYIIAEVAPLEFQQPLREKHPGFVDRFDIWVPQP